MTTDINAYQPKVTRYQVRVLFAQSGRVGIFSFATPGLAFMAFNDVLRAWDKYDKVAMQSINGVSVLETDEIALVSCLNL